MDDNRVHVGEVQFFTRLAIHSASDCEGDPEWSFANIAILKHYSEPDVDLLQLSSQVLAASLLLDDICICNVKNIQSVATMISHTLTLPSGVEGNYFCMMEKPGLDISDLGVPYSIYSQPGNDDDDADDADVE